MCQIVSSWSNNYHTISTRNTDLSLFHHEGLLRLLQPHHPIMSLTVEQLDAIAVVEKVSSGLSVGGAAFIISTFLCSSEFRKPINRLVFYAAWGNLFANVATFISRYGVKLGPHSSLCQFQAFLIQWYELMQRQFCTTSTDICQVPTGRCPVDILHGL